MGPPLRLRRSGVVIVRVRLVRAPTLTRSLRADRASVTVTWRGSPGLRMVDGPGHGVVRGSRLAAAAAAVAGAPPSVHAASAHAARPAPERAMPWECAGSGRSPGAFTLHTMPRCSSPHRHWQLQPREGAFNLAATSVPVGLHLPARIFLSAAAIACAVLRLPVKSSP